MSNDLKELRRSALVAGFGPGAVVDFRADNAPVSGVVAGLEEWDKSFPKAGLQNNQKIHEPRLEKKLGVRGFRVPPVLNENRDDPDSRRLVAVRFPQWLQCPSCDMIKPERWWSREPGRAFRFCAKCTNDSENSRRIFVVPVRFVMACAKGHLDEFPWDYWVQHKEGCSNRGRGLYLKSEGPGLAGLILSCPSCRQSRPMDGIFSKRTWEGRVTCRGHRPWLADSDEDCDQSPVAVQRGASNLYFPVVASALSIPPWTDHLMEVLGDWWAAVVGVAREHRAAWIEMSASSTPVRDFLEELGMAPAELHQAIEERISALDEVNISDLKLEEYQQLTSVVAGAGRDPEFELRREVVPETLSGWISDLVRVVRLREVRALRGFTRINPPGDTDSEEVSMLSATGLSWLPAIDVRGEGVFLSLDQNAVARWERSADVRARVQLVVDRYLADWQERYGSDAAPADPPTARMMLCHSLSHALMRQLTLECGYSSASLQERIYASDGAMAGILIYTATTDADGTLGGLQRQGEQSRFGPMFQRAIAGIEWCSSDPLCISDMMGAISSYSRSTCHSCLLAPETACETYNSCLDRGLLCGTPDNPDIGFLSGLLRGGS